MKATSVKKFRLRRPAGLAVKAVPPAKHIVIEERPIDELRHHPQQKLYFSEMSPPELQALANDIRANGMKELPEILPDGTILSGHQRRRAAIKLNWTTLTVKVRYDLADADEATLQRYLIEANLHRRHLTKLQLARLYDALSKLGDSAAARRGKGDLRDELGKRLGMSGRSLSRLRQLLDLPPILQKAVDMKQLPYNMALALMKLPPEQHEPILQALAIGDNVRNRVRKLLQDRPSQQSAQETVDEAVLRRKLRTWLETAGYLGRHQQALVSLVRSTQQKRLVTAHLLAERLLGVLKGSPSAGETTPE